MSSNSPNICVSNAFVRDNDFDTLPTNRKYKWFNDIQTTTLSMNLVHIDPVLFYSKQKNEIRIMVMIESALKISTIEQINRILR